MNFFCYVHQRGLCHLSENHLLAFLYLQFKIIRNYYFLLYILLDKEPCNLSLKNIRLKCFSFLFSAFMNYTYQNTDSLDYISFCFCCRLFNYNVCNFTISEMHFQNSGYSLNVSTDRENKQQSLQLRISWSI